MLYQALRYHLWSENLFRRFYSKILRTDHRERERIVQILGTSTGVDRTTEESSDHHVYNLQARLNEGRIIKPDEKLKAVLPVAKVDMLKVFAFPRNANRRHRFFPDFTAYIS